MTVHIRELVIRAEVIQDATVKEDRDKASAPDAEAAVKSVHTTYFDDENRKKRER